MDDILARNVAVEAGVGSALRIDVRAVVHHVDRRKMMALAEREVIGIVRGRDFDCAGTELAADPLIEHDGNFAIQERQAQLFAVEMEVALVFGVNGDGRIAEHGFRARRCDSEELAGILAIGAEDRILDLPQVALVLGVNDFKIADGGLAAAGTS